MKVTVLGGRGFIGRHVVAEMQARGAEVHVPARDAVPDPGADLGHVIYAIGLTGDFRSRPYDTVQAHVGVLADWLARARFASWLYLSSTRVYGGLPPGAVAQEEAALPLRPSADSLYDLSKLLGEALCLGHANPRVRVARLANVYGPGQSEATFLGSVLRDLDQTGQVMIGEAGTSSKDYIAISDVARLACDIVLTGQQRIYNIASGQPVTHEAIAQALSRTPGARVGFVPDAPERIFPRIDVTRITTEFQFIPRRLLDDIGALGPGQHPGQHGPANPGDST